MTEILQKSLPFEKAKSYFEKTLKNGNFLAQELLNTIDFTLGNFTSITSILADSSLLENFNSGGILPHNFDNRKIFKREKSSSVDELAMFIEKILFNKTVFNCLFEEVSFKRGAPCLSQMEPLVYCFGEEVYYLLSIKNFSKKTLLECIKKADAQWYYLTIITDTLISHTSHDFTKEDLEKFARETNYLILGAYDMEGYVCWTKNGFL